MSEKLNFIYDSEIFIDLYSQLDIDINSEIEDIKSAYIKLAKKNHPDQGGSSELFIEITRAYEILYNKELRKEYDLYYLKKSMDEFKENEFKENEFKENEFKGDDIIRLKNEYKDFVNVNYKPISKEDLDKIYSDIFDETNNNIEVKIAPNEFTTRINDIKLERENINIESNDEIIANFIKNENINLNDLFEYLKYKNNNYFENKSITVQELGTIDTISNNLNFSSFLNDNDYFNSNYYSDISSNNFVSKENINNFNADEYNNWKSKIKEDKKLSTEDINNFVEKRKNEADNIFKEVENKLSSSAKKKEVKTFLKTKYLSEEISEYNNLETNNKLENIKTNNGLGDEDLYDYEELLNEVGETSINNLKKSKIDPSECNNMYDFMEKIKTEEIQSIKPKKTNLSNETSFLKLKNSEDRKTPKVNNIKKKEYKL